MAISLGSWNSSDEDKAIEESKAKRKAAAAQVAQSNSATSDLLGTILGAGAGLAAGIATGGTAAIPVGLAVMQGTKGIASGVGKAVSNNSGEGLNETTTGATEFAKADKLLKDQEAADLRKKTQDTLLGINRDTEWNAAGGNR